MTLALLLALAAIAGPTAASPKKGGQAVITGDQVKYDYPRRVVTLTGAPVRLTRDDAVLTCRRLVANNDEAGKVVRAVCSGDVQLTRGPRIVTCETAVYEDAAARVTCDGDPVVLKDGATEARGERLTYDLSTDEVTLGKKDGTGGGTGVVITAPGAEIDQRQKDLERHRRAPKGEKR